MPLRTLLAILFCCLTLAAGTPASAADTKPRRSVEQYTMPDVTLVNQDGKKVRFRDYLKNDRPVVLDFIFGTCTTICPVLSAGYVSLQQRLAPDPQQVQLVSISIDPEHDTPRVLKDYLKQYRAKPGWDFLTGNRREIDQVMRAFDSYVPDKMYHKQVTFIRAPGSSSWVRVEGLMSAGELYAEYQKARKP